MLRCRFGGSGELELLKIGICFQEFLRHNRTPDFYLPFFAGDALGLASAAFRFFSGGLAAVMSLFFSSSETLVANCSRLEETALAAPLVTVAAVVAALLAEPTCELSLAKPELDMAETFDDAPRRGAAAA